MKVGLVADGGDDRALLRRALEDLGHVVVFCDSSTVAASRNAPPAVDLLIEVAAGPGARRFPRAECLLLELDAAFLEQARSGFGPWLEGLRRRIANARWWSQAHDETGRAERVWLLAASAGGPEMVAQFIGAVEPFPGVGLLYAQHIDAPQITQLQRWLATSGHWTVELVGADRFLLEGRLAIVDPARRLRLDRERKLRMSSRPWPGACRPSIDLVAESLALTYRDRAGMIVFSGLGDDGVLGSRHLREQGGEVWVQEPRSCLAGALPAAVLAQGAVDYVGDVAALARRFNHRYGGVSPLEART